MELFIKYELILLVLMLLLLVIFLMVHDFSNSPSMKRVLSNWDPKRIFYKEKTVLIDTYISDDKYITDTKQYTKLGEWLKFVPGIISRPLLSIYYALTYSILIICVILDYTWFIISTPVFKK